MANDHERNTIANGFSIPWLVKAFRMTRHHVANRLVDVKPIGRAGKADLYALDEAAKALVSPDIDPSYVLDGLKRQELPTRLQTEVWSALRAEQAYMLEAKQLFRVEAGLDGFTDTLAVVRAICQTAPDNMVRDGLIDDRRHADMVAFFDDLLDQMHQKAIAVAEELGEGPAVAQFAAKIGALEKGE